MNESDVITVMGAGPAGLAAAITLAHAGRAVTVFERQPQVGARFSGDLQGLENWTTDKDVMNWLQHLKLSTGFVAKPLYQGEVFDAWGSCYPVRSEKPLFYLIERGPGSGSLDSALLRQALDAGVDIKFNCRIKQLSGEGIVATGPKAADAIAVGYHFETGMQDGFWLILDDNIAPKGYSYLLVMDGRGTVKTCMFTGFKEQALYLKRTVAAFENYTGLQMGNSKFYGGVGNFRVPGRASNGIHPIVGEQAGFQDFLWGFGLRYAIQSGVIAANSLLDNRDYENEWRSQLRPMLKNSVLNRLVYMTLGNRGYRCLLRRNVLRNWDARIKLHQLYKPTVLRKTLAPVARLWQSTKRVDVSCDHVDCSCVWCRHGTET